MLNCIVVDDEQIILNEISKMIEQTDIKVQRSFQDPYEALESINTYNPDVAFLDIEMPEFNGIELAKKIASINPQTQIVFITAYEQYALKAFEVSAVHYLLKPITQEKINKAVVRVMNNRQINQNKGEINKPELIYSNIGTEEKISVKNFDSIIIIKISDILYLKSEEGKTIIVTKEGSYYSRTTLQIWEAKLKGMDFLRCHRCYIINANHIAKMVHVLGEYKELVIDYGDVNIPISRKKVGIVKNWLGI